jgi:hypothetical protein
MQRNTGKLAPVAVVTSTPGRPVPPTRIPAPVVIATIEPPHTPQPTPSPSPSPSASVAATAEPTVRPSLEPTPQPSPAPTRKPTPRPAPQPSFEPTPRPSSEPAPAEAREPNARAAASTAAVAVAPASPKALPAQTAQTPAAEPTRRSAESPVAQVGPTQTSSAYDERASAVVRRYIDALIRGDEKTARAALGGGQGALSEQAFLDPGARIVSVKVTRLDASNASVGCEIDAAKGHYYGTYHVTAASNGPYIAEHDYIKV